MAIPKHMGTETEYGISVIGRPDFNPVLASSMVVNAYSSDGRHRARWDYEEENPLRDARGFTQPGGQEAPAEDDSGLANSILPNGARFYVDHAHPEYSSPECSNPRDAVIWDKAGERILESAAKRAEEILARDHGQGGRILITKNNTDGKGAAYGMHENYIVARSVPFGQIVRQITPFFVTRLGMIGAGRLGNEFDLADVPYQISQRADFFEVEVGLETTLKRPIVNTRDEPHADPDRFRRLHVIVGDANLSEVCTYLKLGATALVLAMVEDDALPEPPALAQPVKALHAVSHDLTCRQPLELDDGRRATPIELQWHYLEQAKRYCKVHETAPEWAADVLTTWERILTALEDDPMSLDGVVDWVTKYRLIQRYVDRDGLGWEADKLKVVDVQYHDVRQDKGLYNKLAAAGRIERLIGEDEVRQAVHNPPEDTRAYFRGRCLDKYRDEVAAAGWDSIIFDVGRETLQRVPMMDPGRGGKDTTQELIDRCDTAAELLDEIQR